MPRHTGPTHKDILVLQTEDSQKCWLWKRQSLRKLIRCPMADMRNQLSLWRGSATGMFCFMYIWIQYSESIQLKEKSHSFRFPPDIAAQVTIANMRTAIQAARAAQYPPVPVTLYGLGALLQHRQDITTTLDGRDNFLAGVVETPDTTSIIFMSRRMRRLLARSRMIFCDGTFGSRPNNPDSGQVLQIITVIGNAVRISSTLNHNHFAQLLFQIYFLICLFPGCSDWCCSHDGQNWSRVHSSTTAFEAVSSKIQSSHSYGRFWNRSSQCLENSVPQCSHSLLLLALL